MTRVSPGVKFEYKIRDYFQAKGYEVMRAAGSRGALDLIVWNDQEIIGIQCKKEKSKTNHNQAMDDLQNVKCATNMKLQLWVKADREIFIYDNYGRMQLLTVKEINATIKNNSQ